MTNTEFYEELEPLLEQVRKEAWQEGYTEANKEKEPDLLGRENVNFSISGEANVSPERVEEYKRQRIERGFDDTECWNLDTTILQFVLPRLKRFRECTIGYPSEFESLEAWTDCLDKMIDNIDKIIKSEEDADYEGFELFKKYFFNLWW